MTATDLSSLLRRTSIDDHEQVLSAANSVLKKSSTDIDALHAKVVALLHLDRFEDALRALEISGQELQDRARLEHAYALYKAGKLTDAHRVIGEDPGTRGLQHVQAQTFYRAEEFESAKQVYTDLASNVSTTAGEENDLRINSRAVDAQLAWSQRHVSVARKKSWKEDLEAFETTYNAACGCIARGELSQAEILLKRAKDLCNASEDLLEEEKQAEILPIAVQQIYVLYLLGKTDEIEHIQTALNSSDIADPSIQHIFQLNNIVMQANVANPYLTQRLFQESEQHLISEKPFEFQSSLLRENAHVVDLLSLKHDGVSRSTSKAITTQAAPTVSSSINSLSVLNAAAQAKSEIGRAGIKRLLPVLQERPNDVGLLLTIVQLYVSTNNLESAISLLEPFFKRFEESETASLQDVRFTPGLVGILVTLYSLQGRKSHVRTELTKATSYWRRRSKHEPLSSLPKSLLCATGVTLLENGTGEDLSTAIEIFGELHTQDPSDRSIVAGLVAASAAAQEESQRNQISDDILSNLTPIPQLTATVDVDALEFKGIPRPETSSVTANASTLKKRKIEEPRPHEEKKLRKSKVPKDYDPAHPPKLDPERWLPMKERSYWKPKKKRGKGGGAAQGATQGGLAVEEKDKGRTQDAKPAVGSGGGGGGAKKKKKGKGTKW